MINIEKKLRDYLATRFSVPVFVDVPENTPQEFISIERVGGCRKYSVIDTPTVAVQCWGDTTLKACNLSIALCAIMDDFAEEQDVSAVFPNRECVKFPGRNGEPRYQSSYDITTIE